MITHVAVESGHVTLICDGPSMTTCLINSGVDPGSGEMIAAVSTTLGGGVGVGVGVTLGVGVAVGVGVGVGVGGVSVGLGVGVGVAVGTGVGVAAAAVTAPRAVPPS